MTEKQELPDQLDLADAKTHAAVLKVLNNGGNAIPFRDHQMWGVNGGKETQVVVGLGSKIRTYCARTGAPIQPKPAPPLNFKDAFDDLPSPHDHNFKRPIFY